MLIIASMYRLVTINGHGWCKQWLSGESKGGL